MKESNTVPESYNDSTSSTKESEEAAEPTLMTSPCNDPENYSFPFCIVWTPLSLISVLFPCIGHTGICTSKGVIYDYAGSHYATEPEVSFNKPTKYVFLPPTSSQSIQKWDDLVANVNMEYGNNNYNLLMNNCHSYCAYVLNQIKYNGRNNYTMFDVFLMVTFKSQFISWQHYFITYIGFILLIMMIIIMVYCSEY